METKDKTIREICEAIKSDVKQIHDVIQDIKADLQEIKNKYKETCI